MPLRRVTNEGQAETAAPDRVAERRAHRRLGTLTIGIRGRHVMGLARLADAAQLGSAVRKVLDETKTWLTQAAAALDEGRLVRLYPVS